MNANFIRENATYGKVKDWHDPHNFACLNNEDICKNCTCKRPRRKKPFKRVQVRDERTCHMAKQELILEIYPNGTLAIHEQRRRKRVWTSFGDIYRSAIRREAVAAVAARRAARKSRKQSRKGGRR